MELQVLTTIVTGAVLALLTSVIAWQGNGRFRRLESDNAEIRREMHAMRSELTAEIRDVRSEVAAVRSNLTQLAIAFGTHLRPQAG